MKNFYLFKLSIVFSIALLTLFLTTSNVFANNVRKTNVTNTNPGSANPIITFDIAWDNSWRVSSGPSTMMPFGFLLSIKSANRSQIANRTKNGIMRK